MEYKKGRFYQFTLLLYVIVNYTTIVEYLEF